MSDSTSRNTSTSDAPRENASESSLEDDVLVKEARNGDEQSYKRLVNKYERALYYHILKMVKNKEQVEDLVQEAFTPEISGAADFAIYFPENFDWWELNANVHYDFLAEDGMKVYGLGGLNYATMSFSVDFGEFGSASGSNSEVGLNLGGGAEFDVDFANVYTELKYVLGNADQLALSAGLRFNI